MRLYDSSSIVELFTHRKEESVDILREGTRLDLTFYEVGNSIRKMNVRLDRSDPMKAERLMRGAAKILGQIPVTTVTVHESVGIIALSLKHSLSFYDASYLFVALRDELTIVTEDKGLRDAAVSARCLTESTVDFD